MKHETDLHSQNAAPVLLANDRYDSLPVGVFGLMAAAYAMMMLIYWLTFRSHTESAMMVAISAFFVAVFFGTPWLMARQGEALTRKRHGGQAAPRLSDFLSGEIATWTGPMSGWSAVIQVLLIPVGLAFGVLGICLAIVAAR
ncbi:MAG TPA: hypothetical protein VF194_12170 [Ferrovibrio sp.]|jgi:hypothetical protein|uniref:hypothetical protein n=1 Tax=Ferrovibrio sp. TaxID=1917215 RepID=UPI002ED4ECE6